MNNQIRLSLIQSIYFIFSNNKVAILNNYLEDIEQWAKT